jgi:hypothetical protein
LPSLLRSRRVRCKGRLAATGPTVFSWSDVACHGDRASRRWNARCRTPPSQRIFARGVGVFANGGARPPVQAMIAFIDNHHHADRGSSRSAACCRLPRHLSSPCRRADPAKLFARARCDRVPAPDPQRYAASWTLGIRCAKNPLQSCSRGRPVSDLRTWRIVH